MSETPTDSDRFNMTDIRLDVEHFSITDKMKHAVVCIANRELQWLITIVLCLKFSFHTYSLMLPKFKLTIFHDVCAYVVRYLQQEFKEIYIYFLT